MGIKYPPYIQWEVIGDCNHQCLHCYNYWRNDSEVNTISIDKDLIERIAQKIIEQKPAHIVITGGEPMMCFDKIYPVLQEIVSNGILVSINTNATLITDRIAFLLSELQIGCLVSLPCSIGNVCDKITNVSGSLTHIKQGILNLVNHNVDFAVNMVVSQLNKDFVFETAQYAKSELHCKTFFASRVGMPLNADNTFKELMLTKDDMRKLLSTLIQIKNALNMNIGTSNPFPLCLINNQEVFDFFAYERICSAGITTCCVDSTGNVKACPREKTIYGNILFDDFQTIWGGMSKWRDDEYIPKACTDCKHKSGCRGGCRIDSLSTQGNICLEDTLCDRENKNTLSLTPAEINISHYDNYVFSTQINCQPDGEYVRLSSKMEFIYLTADLYDLLYGLKSFNIAIVASRLNVSVQLVSKIFYCLIQNNIIVQREQ